LLFGCGLRQFECLQLRVRDFNFDAGRLTIHGKAPGGPAGARRCVKT
jgi:integrase